MSIYFIFKSSFKYFHLKVVLNIIHYIFACCTYYSVYIGLNSNAAAIMMKEMFNITNITLASFYLDAFDVLSSSSFANSMIASHFELYPADFDPEQWKQLTSITNDLTDLLSGIEIFAGIYAQTDWLNNNENNFDLSCEYGDFWRAYSNPDIIENFMTKSNEIPNVIQDDGFYECSPERFDFFDDYPCINGTFKPPQCQSYSSNCSSIIGFSPYYDLGLIQSFLTDFSEINLDIKYVGEQEIAAIHLDEYMSSYDALYTFWQPSIMVSSGRFELIQLPSQYITQQMSDIHILIPTYLNTISSFIYEFYSSVKMNNYDYEWILQDFYTKTNGFNQTSLTRLEASCSWLRHVLLDDDDDISDDLTDPIQWIPTYNILSSDIDECGDLTYEQYNQLLMLDDYGESELFTTLQYRYDTDIVTVLDEAGMKDLLQAFRTKEKCQSYEYTNNEESDDDDDDDGGNGWMIVGIIFIILFVIAMIWIIYTFINNKKQEQAPKHMHSHVASTEMGGTQETDDKDDDETAKINEDKQ